MKNYSTYTDSAISELLENKGAFFAFGTKQFEESKKEGVKYVQMSSGLICPKENADSLISEMNAIYKKADAEYLAENGIDNIIKYELANHECYYTGEWLEAYHVTANYGATKDQVLKIYNENFDKYE